MEKINPNCEHLTEKQKLHLLIQLLAIKSDEGMTRIYSAIQIQPPTQNVQLQSSAS